MSYHVEKGTEDLVIDGWENGIASSPFKGMGDLKSGNTSTLPGEVSLSYNRQLQTQIPIVSAGSFTGFASNILHYTAFVPLLRGSWVLINSSTITNLSNSSYYYVLSVNGNEVTISATYEGSIKNDLGTSGSAGFTTVPMGQLIGWTSTDVVDYPNYEYFVLDSNGRVWKSPPGEVGADQANLGIWSLIDYTAVAAADSKSGIFYYDNDAGDGYIMVVTDSVYYKIGSDLGHSNSWTKLKDNNGSDIATLGAGHYHSSIKGVDGVVYICDGNVDSLSTVSGQTFDPTNQNTYTWTPKALLISSNDESTCIAQATIQGGITLFIGGLSNILYNWTPSNNTDVPSPLFLAENFTQNLLTVNNLVYIFAGSKGNIYVTNGSSVTTVLTVPDYVANSQGGNQDPFYIWGGVMYLRGRIWFSVQAPNCGGIWSFVPTINYYAEQDAGIQLRCENENSYDTYSGYATILFQSQASTGQLANGPQYYSGWDDGSRGGSANPYGIDFSDTVPASSGALIESDAIPTGTLLKKKTFANLEYKLATAPLTVTFTVPLNAGATSGTLSSTWTGRTIGQNVLFSNGEIRVASFTDSSTSVTWSGALSSAVSSTLIIEVVQIYYRTDLNASWSTPTSKLTIENNTVSGFYTVDFQNTQWLQLQVLLTSTTATGATFTPLREITIR